MSSEKDLRVDIIIPTFNRAHLIERAVQAALNQSYWNRLVTVVDDGSNDATKHVLQPYFSRPDFSYIQLKKNLGTASAKNAGLLLTGGPAVTFHDSDDIVHRDKVLRQLRVLTRQDVMANECLNWAPSGKQSGTRIDVDAVLTHHSLILPDGRQVDIRRNLSLIDDVFPNLQMGAEVPGDWTHVNSGLFRQDVFARFGGFENCIEEDREFRNRIILNGAIVWVIPELLLTKIETSDSLTQSAASDYDSAQRRADRDMVWAKVAEWRSTGKIAPVPVDLPDLEIGFASNPAALLVRDIPMSKRTAKTVRDVIATSWNQPVINTKEAAE
jgi:glycosyltransferase involved in cell wall biosynthesis